MLDPVALLPRRNAAAVSVHFVSLPLCYSARSCLASGGMPSHTNGLPYPGHGLLSRTDHTSHYRISAFQEKGN